MTDVLPDLSIYPNLDDFYVGGNNITGNIDASFFHNNIRRIDISSNDLEGIIPNMSSLSNLYYFDASGNDSLSTDPLTGDIPSFNSTSIKEINVGNNNLTETLTSNKLATYVNLERFRAYDNDLKGEMPDLNNNPKLRDFNLGSNELTGEIPPLINNVDLEDFAVYNNQLTGNIPLLNNNIKLEYFGVGDNNLDGPIPNLDNNVNLREFSAYDNNLEGPLPSLNNNSLEYFNVNRNQIDGNIPNLSNLNNLRNFSVDDNLLTGNIPNLDNNVNLEKFTAYDQQFPF